MLKRIGDVLGLNSRIIHIFAKKYADSLKDEIAKISANRNRLQSSINFIENLKTSYKNITYHVEKVLEQKKKVLEKNERISEINSEMETLIKNVAHLEKQVLDLKSSNDYSKFLEIKSNIHSMSSEKDEIKNILDMQFSKISRPLGKYSYISSFEKPVRKMMEVLISDPYEVISQQNKSTIIQILEAVAKSVSSGSISVKDTDKSLEQIQETISKLDEFIKLKESHSSKISTLEKDLIVFDIKFLETIEHDLENKKTSYTNLESVKKKLEVETSDANSLLAKYTSEIESGLASLTKSKITLKA
jgi:DNA repair exonuclease SbcCD ATPase subunit